MPRPPDGRGFHGEQEVPEHGYRTFYNGVRYRSRLEARWAAFFECLRWEVHYEHDDKIGWIPDFLLVGKIPVLVEVKPHPELLQETKDKVLRSGAEYDILVTRPVKPLAAGVLDLQGVLMGRGLEALSHFGWLYERTGSAGEPFCGGAGKWSRCYFGIIPGSSIYSTAPIFGFSTLEANWLDRITGCTIDPTFSFCGDYRGPLPHDLWNWAGNEVQWRKGEDRSV